MRRFLGVLLVLLVFVGCGSDKPDCQTGMILPGAYPVLDNFGVLIFKECDYTHEEMRVLRDTMRNTALEVTACLDSVYGYEFATQNPDGSKIPYFSKIAVVSAPLKPPHTNIKFTPAGSVVTYHPTLSTAGGWSMEAWAGELHTMYRGYMLGSFQHSVIYNENLPFEKAAKLAHNACIVKWIE